MTVTELIAELQKYPADTRVTLQDPDTNWLLQLKITKRAVEGVDFVAFTGSYIDSEFDTPGDPAA
jgi:hypothetical protein